ncbi:MAG: hypothetical protein IKB51_06875 [Clostridia bacterium]|nr:hypothetical protein [Clostridia bacterium]
MKRIISIIMAFMMVCLLTVAVFAEGESIIGRTFTLTDEGGNVCEVKILDETRFYVQISQDGSMLGTYTLNGEYITLLVDDKVFENYKIIGDAIVYEEQPAPEAPNVFSRLWEYVVKNKDTVLEIAFSAVMFILLWIIKKKTNNLKTDVTSASANSISVADSQSGVVGVVNTMIDGYNAFKSDFEKVKQSDTERDKQLAAVMVTNTAILEILSRVYPNSKNLPQGVKDVVNMTYANAMNAISNDEQLAALVTASKGLLAAGTEKAASDEEAV